MVHDPVLVFVAVWTISGVWPPRLPDYSYLQAASPAVQIAAKKTEETRVAEAASEAARVPMLPLKSHLWRFVFFFPNFPLRSSSIDFSDTPLIFSQVYLPMSIPHVTCLGNSQKLLNSISISHKSHLLHQKEGCDGPDRSGMVKMMRCTTELKILNKNEPSKSSKEEKQRKAIKRQRTNIRDPGQALPWSTVTRSEACCGLPAWSPGWMQRYLQWWAIPGQLFIFIE